MCITCINLFFTEILLICLAFSCLIDKPIKRFSVYIYRIKDT